MDCFDESLHPYLKIFYQASITCNLVVEGDFMQASHRASQITSVDDGHRHRHGFLFQDLSTYLGFNQPRHQQLVQLC
jgi:hypothetical protein